MAGFERQLRDAMPHLWRYAYALTRDRAAADDLVQDCAERALRKRWLWLPSKPLKPWLMKILLNLYRNQWQADRLRQTEPLDETAQALDLAPPERRLEVLEVLAQVKRLPEDQRQALLIVVVGGLSYADAAQALGIPAGTLMSRIARARKKLRSSTDTAQRPQIRSVK